MKFGWIAALAAVIVAPVVAAPAAADELVIRKPLAAYNITLEALKAGYEASSGDKIKIVEGNDVPADLVITFKTDIEAQFKAGKLVSVGADVAEMRVGMAVKEGAAKPDISTPDKFKAAMLAAKSVAVSRGPSGQYLTTELFPKLGIADQMKPKTVVVTTGLVAEVVPRGEAEAGFQQMSELLPIKGISIVGPLPESIQRVTVYTAAITTDAKAGAAAMRFIAYVKSPAAAAAYKATTVGQIK